MVRGSLLRLCNQRRIHDIIGQPDPLSNIAPIKLKTPSSQAEKKLQRLQLEAWQLNHNFWSRHNQQFKEEKAKFVSRIQTDSSKVTASELSGFYKQFLDDKYTDHMQYSKQWLKLQFKLTWISLKVRMQLILKLS